jgi:predicted P-loop ATPase
VIYPKYFQVADDAFSRGVSQAFMIGAVKRAFEPGCKFDTMPILKGAQGKAKSSGYSALFGAEFFSDAALDLTSKDSIILLQGKWFHEFAELDSMSRIEESKTKAYVSRSTDRFRPVFGKVPVDMPRRIVFGGSVNLGGYLRDPTGARRYWPLEVVDHGQGIEVDVVGLKNDRDQIWAEAMHLYRSIPRGEYLPIELWSIAEERTTAETPEDPWADDIRDFLEERLQNYKDWQNKAGDFDPLNVGRFDPDKVAPEPYRVLSQELLKDALKLPTNTKNKTTTSRVRVTMEATLKWKYKYLRVKGAKPDKGWGYESPEAK